MDFEVLQDISVNGTQVISKGSFAFGTVTEAQPKRRMARGGKLEINIDYVKLVSSEKAALRAVKGGKGGGHTGYMTAGIVGAGILFFPAAPFFRHARQGHSLPEGNRVHCLCQRRYKARYCEVSARSRAATGSKRQQA